MGEEWFAGLFFSFFWCERISLRRRHYVWSPGGVCGGENCELRGKEEKGGSGESYRSEKSLIRRERGRGVRITPRKLGVEGGWK